MALFNYECDEVKRKIQEVSPNYPQLTTYEREWLYFNKYHYIPGIPVELECETVTVNPYGSVTNAIPFAYKSAILKGQTKILDDLGNECSSINSPSVTTGAYINTTNGGIVPSTVSFYTGFLKCPTVDFHVKGDNRYKRVSFYDKNKVFISGIDKQITDNTTVKIGLSDIPKNAVYIRISASTSGDNTSYTPNTNLFVTDINGKNLIINHLESVKMPVLKTVGKNLFKPNNKGETGGLTFTVSSNNYLVNGTCTKDNTDFYLFNSAMNVDIYQKLNSLPIGTEISVSKNNKVGRQIYLCITQKDGSATKYAQKYTTTENDKNIEGFVRFMKGDTFDNAEMNIQVEINSEPTSYEPFKTNILTVSEEVELRGIGDVQDELNLLTGELTQRIGEVVLNGNEGWAERTDKATETHKTYYLRNTSIKASSPFICDKLANTSEDNVNGIFSNGWDSKYFFITLSKSTVNNVNGLKTYLQQNPIKVQYQLETESVKTVDLTPLNKPYEGTNHYQLTANIPCKAILKVPVVSTGKQTLEEINN